MDIIDYQDYDLDIFDIIKHKDERALIKYTIAVLERLISGKLEKNVAAYFPDQLVTVPIQLKWKDNYNLKNKVLDDVLSTISNFEGDTKKEAIRKSREMIKKLRNL